MCTTCRYSIYRTMDGMLTCSCTQSEYYRDPVDEENICSFYEERPPEPCAMDNGVSCKALTKKKCPGCRFYKTKAQLTWQKESCARRIGRLPYKKRQAIRETYKIF